MSPQIPTSTRYLVGSLLASFVGALVLVLFGGSLLEHGTGSKYFPFVVFVTPFLFVAFLVIGWPLFFMLRSTRWFRFWPAAIVGAAVGVAASALFGGPGFNLVSVGFAAVGVLSVAVCWWFIRRPNPSVVRDASRQSRSRPSLVSSQDTK